MTDAVMLISAGILFLAGLALDKIGRVVHVPRVTLLILFGAVMGPPVLDLLPRELTGQGDLLTAAALTMVAFLLGGQLERRALAALGPLLTVLSLTVVVVTVAGVAAGLWALGVPLVMALLLGGVASATDPAATVDVIRQARAHGRFPRLLMGVVAIDDAWGLIAFSVILTLAGAVAGEGANGALAAGLRDLAGSVLLGLAVGLPGAYLTGRLKPGEPSLMEALGIVALTAGLGLWLELSYLLSGMVAGATIVNLAFHHDRPFHEIERIEWPFLLIFFVAAGAALDLGGIETAGLAGAGYVLLRMAARIAGGWAGARIARSPGREGALAGAALMPQAGIAIGMALVAAERFPEHGEAILAITVASTVFFEVVGPFLTLWALRRADADG